MTVTHKKISPNSPRIFGQEK